LRRPDITFWSAWLERKLAGCAALKELDAGHWRNQIVCAHAKAHLGKGVASKLLQHLIAEARRRGYPQIEPGNRIDAVTSNPHAGLYRKFGFTTARHLRATSKIQTACL
jgi:putative acetyltransferase